MLTLEKAIDILKREIPSADPVAYWDKKDKYIFRMRYTGQIGGNFYVVDAAENVYGTNPLNDDLNIANMKKL